MDNKSFSTKHLLRVLDNATEDENVSLTIICRSEDFVKTNGPRSPRENVESLFFSTPYLTNLHRVAEKLKITVGPKKLQMENWDVNFSSNTERTQEIENHILSLEERILNEVLKQSYENLSDDEKSEFDKTVRVVASEHGKSAKGLAGTAGLMVAANAGGFSTYMLMSSLLSTISFGTLGFGAYTAASSILSTLIGPVGWAGLGIYAAYKFFSPNYKELIPGVTTMAFIRQRVNYEAEQRRLEEERIIAEEKRLAEKRRLAEEKRLAEVRRIEEEKRLAEQIETSKAERLEHDRKIDYLREFNESTRQKERALKIDNRTPPFHIFFYSVVVTLILSLLYSIVR